MKRILMTSLCVGLFVVPPASASLTTEATHLRAQVIHKLGKRAPGRDIVRWGMASRGKSRDATRAEIQHYVNTLRNLLAPPPVVTATRAYRSAAVSAPAGPPAGGLASCIISRESGGNPSASNGQYTGIAQWSPSSWAGGGGTKYAPSPTAATYSQQLAVLNSMLASGQSSQWTPYDGC